MPPVRSETNGIAYKINAESRHQRAHIHIVYGEYAASIALDTLEVLAGNVPAKKLNEALEWIGRHRRALTTMYTNRFTPGAVRKLRD